MAEDVAVLVIANAGIIERAGSVGGDAAERFVALALDGLRAAGATHRAARRQPTPPAQRTPPPARTRTPKVTS